MADSLSKIYQFKKQKMWIGLEIELSFDGQSL